MKNLAIVLCIEANLSQENNNALLNLGIALHKGTNFPIQLFHVIENKDGNGVDTRFLEVENYLNHSLAELVKLGVPNATAKIEQGDFKSKLVENYPDSHLIVLGKSGLDNKNQHIEALGSNLEAIIMNSKSPVLIQKKSALDEILLAFDGRASIAKVTECPLFLSLANNARCVHVVSINNNLPLLEEQHELLCDELKASGIKIKSVFIDKCKLGIAEKLAEYERTNQIGLTVIGAFAKAKVRPFFLGSQTSKLLKEINSSIMFYR
ncbi:hypothetical protein [Thorsellia kenyensis]|uniref:Universal stress protein n=1 Tax=Thorsellia kenyensis TaxID=1549888 RepID=A0ABV6CIA2_9GAMM